MGVVIKKQSVFRLSDIDWGMFDNFRVIVMCGLPGSGKSYIACKLAAETGRDRLSSDAIRVKKYVEPGEGNFFNSNAKYEKFKELVYAELHQAVIEGLLQGRKVVVDATYLGSQREDLLVKLKANGWLDQTIIVVVRTGEGTIRERIKQKASEMKRGQAHRQDWERVYAYFTDKLASGEIRYPNGKLDGVEVLELWNE